MGKIKKEIIVFKPKKGNMLKQIVALTNKHKKSKLIGITPSQLHELYSHHFSGMELQMYVEDNSHKGNKIPCGKGTCIII